MFEACVFCECVFLGIDNLADEDFVEHFVLKVGYDTWPVLVGVLKSNGTSLVGDKESGMRGDDKGLFLGVLLVEEVGIGTVDLGELKVVGRDRLCMRPPVIYEETGDEGEWDVHGFFVGEAVAEVEDGDKDEGKKDDAQAQAKGAGEVAEAVA